MSKKVIIIGAGVGGLAAACILGQAGYVVMVYAKNGQPGGRAGTFEFEGFRFDTGPSWYLMPDVFEHFFQLIGENVNQLLDLKRLDPSYQIYFKDTLFGGVDIVGDLEKDAGTLEAIEPGSRNKLHRYVDKSTSQYNLAMDKFLYKNYDSLRDFFTPQMLTQGLRMNIFSNMKKYVSKHFSSEEVRKIMQYHLVFLGASPKNAPALYNMMSHIDFTQGVFYPQGGIYKLVESLVTLAQNRGVDFLYNKPVTSIIVKDQKARGIRLDDGQEVFSDIVISNADIAHTELKLLQSGERSYPSSYWSRRTIAPSALLMYLGVKKEYPNLRHHNLLFSKDWDANFKALFETHRWPGDPSFYICNPNKTDPSTAPAGHENLFVLVPLPPTVKYSEYELDKYADWILKTMEQTMHLDGLREHIVYKKLFAAKDFEQAFNSYKGTSLGLAHTLKQTAIFRPSNKSKKIENLYYVGANTSPGIGLPMCLISAELVYKRLIGDVSNKRLEFIKSTK